MTLYENGNLTVENFSMNEMLAVWMHEKARQIIEGWFKEQQKGRLVIPERRMPGL